MESTFVPLPISLHFGDREGLLSRKARIANDAKSFIAPTASVNGILISDRMIFAIVSTCWPDLVTLRTIRRVNHSRKACQYN
jgi:hypothetical protein